MISHLHKGEEVDEEVTCKGVRMLIPIPTELLILSFAVSSIYFVKCMCKNPFFFAVFLFSCILMTLPRETTGSVKAHTLIEVSKVVEIT